MVIGIHHRHRWHHRDWRPQIERTVKCPSTKAPATDSHQHTWAGNESNYSAEKASFRHLSAIVTAQSTASPLIHWTVSRSVFVRARNLWEMFSRPIGLTFMALTSYQLHFTLSTLEFSFDSPLKSRVHLEHVSSHVPADTQHENYWCHRRCIDFHSPIISRRDKCASYRL